MNLSWCYLSTATPAFDPQRMDDLYQSAREINAARGIRGVLLYSNDRFSLAVYGMDRFNTDIIVTDVRGAVVYSTVHRPAGQSGIEFSGQELGLSEGMYLIRATNEAGNSTQKLVIGK